MNQTKMSVNSYKEWFYLRLYNSNLKIFKISFILRPKEKVYFFQSIKLKSNLKHEKPD
jgi:hypothetical protein